MVGESVVVIKSLLQLKSEDNVDMIRSLVKSLDKISVPMAKASIIWLIGEYCQKVPLIAPDVMRRFSKSFATEVAFYYYYYYLFLYLFIFLHEHYD